MLASGVRRWRHRNVCIALSSVGPSAPQIHERLSELPSRLSSPFASLCFSLYETTSLSVKPSWATMKLTQAQALGPRKLNLSGEAQRRGATDFASPWPRQKSLTSSRNRSFHSAHPG